jgi:uncharacterized coiled-coil protein SlyX
VRPTLPPPSRGFPARASSTFASAWLGAALIATAAGLQPAAATEIPDEVWNAVLEQNRQLAAQLAAQQRQIEDLRARLDALTSPVAPPATSPLASQTRATAPPDRVPDLEPPGARGSNSIADRFILTGEAGVAFFSGQSDNAFPNSEFRVDEAKLFLEAEIARGVYLFTGLDLIVRETADEFFRLGELYVEFEGLSAPWAGRDGSFTLRAGRLALAFGEEYQRRGVMRNPLITHSLADIWGIDEGIEIFGRAGPVDYVLAVQNGGHPQLRDYDPDKSVVLRIGGDPARWLRISASLMRTGDLDAEDDGFSEAWYGNGFFRSIGAPETTTVFGAELAQIDFTAKWRGGRLRGDYGRVWYDDDDTSADNRRRLEHWQLEVVQNLTTDLYTAVRYSRIDTDRGYPLVGLSRFGKYLFAAPPTRDLWRIGLGLGYRFKSNLLLKAEYTIENGSLVTGAPRDDADLISAEAGMKF